MASLLVLESSIKMFQIFSAQQERRELNQRFESALDTKMEREKDLLWAVAIFQVKHNLAVAVF